MSFAKNISNKYSKKLLDSAKKSTADAIITVSKKSVQKTAEATGDLIGNKVAYKITSTSQSSKELQSQNELKIPKERYLSPYEGQQIIDELSVV